VKDEKTVHSAFVHFPEVVRKKIKSIPWEQAIDDVRPYIASPDDLFKRESD
jgi:hypothetical protein